MQTKKKLIAWCMMAGQSFPLQVIEVYLAFSLCTRVFSCHDDDDDDEEEDDDDNDDVDDDNDDKDNDDNHNSDGVDDNDNEDDRTSCFAQWAAP